MKTLLDITEIDGRFAITIAFEMKDSLKKAIPSAKWDAKHKEWTVGPRSLKKLKDWVTQAKLDFNAEEMQTERDEFAKKVDGSLKIKGHTFSHKDLLKDKYNAFLKGKSWWVAKDKFEEAQSEVDGLNIQRKKQDTFICKSKIDKQDLDSIAKALKAVIKNIKENGIGYGTYENRDDDFFKLLSENGNALDYDFIAIRDYLKNTLNGVNNTISDIDEYFFHDPEQVNEFLGNFNYRVLGKGFPAKSALNFFGLDVCNAVRVKQPTGLFQSSCQEINLINEIVVIELFNEKDEAYRDAKMDVFKSVLETNPDVMYKSAKQSVPPGSYDNYANKMVELFDELNKS